MPVAFGPANNSLQLLGLSTFFASESGTGPLRSVQLAPSMAGADRGEILRTWRSRQTASKRSLSVVVAKRKLLIAQVIIKFSQNDILKNIRDIGGFITSQRL